MKGKLQQNTWLVAEGEITGEFAMTGYKEDSGCFAYEHDVVSKSVRNLAEFLLLKHPECY